MCIFFLAKALPMNWDVLKQFLLGGGSVLTI